MISFKRLESTGAKMTEIEEDNDTYIEREADSKLATANGRPQEERDGSGGTLCGRAKRVLSSVHVEPFVLCYIMSRTLMLLATQNLSLQKACRVNLGLSNDTCTALADPSSGARSESTAEVDSQKLVATMFVWQLVVQSSVPCALSVFVGSWSDRNRKRVPCMLLPMASELVRVLGLLACVHYFYELPMEVVGLVEALPTSLAGGRMVFFNAVFSYVSDVTEVSRFSFKGRWPRDFSS